MLEDLDKLIEFIQDEYFKINKQWEESDYYCEINLRKKEVRDLLNNTHMLDSIFNYREFLNENNVQLSFDFKEFNNDNSEVSTRVKLKNSTEDKINRYIEQEKHQYGKVAINKCLNDMFGIRIIFKQEFNYEQMLKYVKEKYEELKCIDAEKNGYKGIHVYFQKNNFNFPWELQIWNKKDEANNKNLHEAHKQGYAKWEKQNKEGDN